MVHILDGSSGVVGDFAAGNRRIVLMTTAFRRASSGRSRPVLRFVSPATEYGATPEVTARAADLGIHEKLPCLRNNPGIELGTCAHDELDAKA